ncbi:hypothetical protein ACFL1H_07790, partial [Nanoarchaeota archaeon]
MMSLEKLNKKKIEYYEIIDILHSMEEIRRDNLKEFKASIVHNVSIEEKNEYLKKVSLLFEKIDEISDIVSISDEI